MGFTPGNFDFVAQVNTSALDVIVDVIFETLKKQNKTKFMHTIGSGPLAFTVAAELSDISIPEIKTIDINQRFKRGNTLASFEVEAILTFTLLGANLQDTIAVRLKDLQIAFATSNNLPVGIALGFKKIDIDVSGLGILNSLLNTLVDFIALGIRIALSPLGLVPIPIMDFAQAFAKQGFLFDQSTSPDGSPFVGITQSRSGLFLVADFQAANNTPGNINVVQDILTDPSMNVGAVISERLVAQAITTALVNDSFGLVKNIASGGINFAVVGSSVFFQNPSARAARITVNAEAAARVRVRKGGFFGKLFGKKKKVTIRLSATLTVDAGVKTDPNTQVSVVDFKYALTARGRATINSILAGVLNVVLGPFLLVFLLILTQLLNFAIDFFLPKRFKFDVSGADLIITIDNLDLSLAPSLGLGNLNSATLKARIAVDGEGTFELSHFTVKKVNDSKIPIAVDYSPQSLATRGLFTPGGRVGGELFLGAGLRSI